MEVVALDNKMDGKESLIQVQVAIDQGIRFIAGKFIWYCKRYYRHG